ncbi:MAG: hypothetical protein NZ533_09610 [Casimicrobiaceae bacterium]|nr:hypothetical protein [Casimicrobiaceae bacterium]
MRSYESNAATIWEPQPTTNGVQYWKITANGWPSSPASPSLIRWSSVGGHLTDMVGYITTCPGYAPEPPSGSAPFPQNPKVALFLRNNAVSGSRAIYFWPLPGSTPVTTVTDNGDDIVSRVGLPGLNEGRDWYFVILQRSCDANPCPRSQYHAP